MEKLQNEQHWRENPVIKALVHHWVLIIALLALFQFICATNHLFFFEGGDNAHYFSLAQSLVSGQGYTDINTYPPEPHTKYPFFFPLMLSAILFFFGENIFLIKILIAISATIMIGMTALLWERRNNRLIAFLTTLLVATVPFTLDYSILVLSEIPFAAFICLTLFFADKAVEKGIKSTAFILCVLFLIIAYFTRSAGITLAPALVCTFLLTPPIRERFRQNIVMAATVALAFTSAAGAWYIRCKVLTHGQGKGYLSEFFMRDTTNLDSPIICFSDLINRIGINGKYYLQSIGTTLWPFSSITDFDKMAISGSIIVIISLIGFIIVIKKHQGAPELFMIFYIPLILNWNISEVRFLIPLYPLIIYYLLKGAEGILLLASRTFHHLKRPAIIRTALAVIVMTMLVSNLKANVIFLKWANNIRTTAKGFEINPFFHIIAATEGMKRMLGLAVYLRHHSDLHTVVLARKPRLVSLASNRPVVGGPFDPDPAKFIAKLEEKHVKYILIDEVFEDVKTYFFPSMKAYPERFRLACMVPGTHSALFQFLPEQHSAP